MSIDMEEWLLVGRDELGDETRKAVWDQIIESHAPKFGLLT